ncbi:MAG TPA: hypothetical protein VFK38_03750 [Candidatus Limnocylindrales bacterium]|nr:hypothetical protein [Candidatus Limnocylindrales bacterium]
MGALSTPLVAGDRLLVDGNNVLHRLSGGVADASRRLLLARLRAAMPEGVTAVVALDGPPDPGGPWRERIGRTLEVRHAGHRAADALIVELVDGVPRAARASLIVVSDDRALGDRCRSLGATVRRLAWFEALLARAEGSGRGGPARLVAGATIGRRSKGPGPAPAARREADGRVDPEPADERPPWRPGRGATRKQGNPARSPRRARG